MIHAFPLQSPVHTNARSLALPGAALGLTAPREMTMRHENHFTPPEQSTPLAVLTGNRAGVVTSANATLGRA